MKKNRDFCLIGLGALGILFGRKMPGVKVIADAEQIRRVIHNIINNSLKYMDKPKGKINLRVKDVGDFVQVELEDNGCGIAPGRPERCL